jgi:hypothetical protein
MSLKLPENLSKCQAYGQNISFIKTKVEKSTPYRSWDAALTPRDQWHDDNIADLRMQASNDALQ